MNATLLDGKALSARLRASWQPRVAALEAAGTPPTLAVLLVGEHPASQVYVRNKIAACAQLGMRSLKFLFAADASQDEVMARIAALNVDPAVHGILVQLPLPRGFDDTAVLEAIAPEKDVDGFHAINSGLLLQNRPGFVPCTPAGVMALLNEAGIDPAGKEVVVIGRSNIVGKPMAMLLINTGATVTVCHSRTQDLAAHCRRAEILIAAVGHPKLVRGDWVRPGAVVIDVGINRLDDGRLCGDVDFEAAAAVAGAITPVPGGVGPMTIAMLLGNTLTAAERSRAD